MSALQSEVLTLNFLSDSRQTPAAITKHFCVFFFFSFQWPKGSSNMNSPENLNSSNMSNNHWKQRNPSIKPNSVKKWKLKTWTFFYSEWVLLFDWHCMCVYLLELDFLGQLVWKLLLTYGQFLLESFYGVKVKFEVRIRITVRLVWKLEWKFGLGSQSEE